MKKYGFTIFLLLAILSMSLYPNNLIRAVTLHDISSIEQTKLLVTGIVTDQKGDPLPGATVIEVDTDNGVITDLDGGFTLDVSSNKSEVDIPANSNKADDEVDDDDEEQGDDDEIILES